MDVLADGVVVLHGAFVLFVVVGGFLAWRPAWRRVVIPLHLAAVAWGIGLVAVGYDCPLTSLERWLRRRGGGDVPRQGFVDRFIEGHLYPESAAVYVQIAVLAVVLVSWWGWISRPGARRRRSRRCSPAAGC